MEKNLESKLAAWEERMKAKAEQERKEQEKKEKAMLDNIRPSLNSWNRFHGK